MTSKSEQRAISDQRVLAYLQSNSNTWMRVVDVSRGCGISARSAIMTLSRLFATNIHNIERSHLTKKRNGCKYPVYRLRAYTTDVFPAWLAPAPPQFTPSSIVSIRGHYINESD